MEVLLLILVTLASFWLETVLESVAVMVHGVEWLLHVHVSSFLAPYHLHCYLRPNITSLVDVILPLSTLTHFNEKYLVVCNPHAASLYRSMNSLCMTELHVLDIAAQEF